MKKQRPIKNLIIVALVWATGHASAQYTFVKVADTDMTFPAPVGTFGTFNPPALSGGKVAFTARFGLSGQAIVTDSGGTLRIVAKNGDPGPVGTWTSFLSFVPAISGGEVVFGGIGSAGQGIFSDNAGTLTVIARTGDSGPVGTWAGFNFGVQPAVSEGTTAFVGGGTLGGGVFTESGGLFTPIARIGGVAPAGTFNLFTGGGMAISGSTAAFIGGYSAGAGLGLFTGSGGPLVMIVERGYSGPAVVGTFVSFSPPAISGSVVAFGVLGTAGQGLFTGDGSAPPTPIVVKGDSVPGGGTFSSFVSGGLSISGSTVAFSGRYNSDADRGIFVRTGGALTKVIAVGDSLFGSLATDVNMSFFALDPDGSVAFNYTLANGRSGVAIASPTTPNLPPVAIASVQEDVDLDGGDPTVFVISPDGVNAAVTLDGTASYDPDLPPDLPLTYDWFVDGSVSPAGSGATFATSLSVGPHTVGLRVTDSRGLEGLLASVDVMVITRKDAITILEQKVNASSLTDIQKYKLNLKLAEAVGYYVAGDPVLGCSEFCDFQTKLNLYLRRETSASRIADLRALIALAEVVGASIDCSCP